MGVVWHLSIINLENKTLLSGVVLKRTPFTYNQETSTLRNALNLVKTYFIPSYKNVEIVANDDGQIYHAITDNKGGFSIELDHTVLEIPVVSTVNSEALEIIQNYPVIFDYRATSLNVISDFDDTIIISHTASALKRIRTMTFILPGQRKSIDSTCNFLKELEKHKAGIFYLSKSENNLFGMLTSFLKQARLPLGALILTSYLKLFQLLNPQKGEHYKSDYIRFLFNNSEDKKFILMGDDSQRDMEIFREIALEYPHRILKIYIRKTKTFVSVRQKKNWRSIEKTGIPARYFKAKDMLNSEIASLVKTIKLKK